MQAGVEKAAHGEHVPGALFAVKMHDVAMKVDIAGEWRRNHLQSAHALDQWISEQGGMLDAEARILFRGFLLDLFIDSEDAVNCQVAIGVGGQLPASEMRLAA